MSEKKKDPRGGNHLWEKFLARANGDIAEAMDLQHQFWRDVQKNNRVSHDECEHEKTKHGRMKCRRARAKAIDNAVAE